MAKTKSGMAKTLAQQLNQYKREEQETAGKEGFVSIPGPVGRMPLSAFYVDGYKAEPGQSIFSEPEKHLIDPQPGHIYVWMERALKRDQGLRRALRSGKYKSVHPSRLKPDSDLAASAFTVAEDEKCLCVGDLALVEGTPRAVAEDYKSRELMAVMKSTRGVGVNSFYEQAAKQGLRVDPEQIQLKETEVEIE